MAASHPPVKVTILISGSGSNLQALIDASQTSALPNVSLVRVISDRKAAYGLTRAQNANIPTEYLGFPPYRAAQKKSQQEAHPEVEPDSNLIEAEARKAYDVDLAKLVLKDSPQLVICAGFMRIVTPSFLNPLKENNVRIINLHPSLHGDLVGAHCIERAWEEYDKHKTRTKTGIMIHYVIAEVDMGEPIEQQEVPIVGCTTLEELQNRIHEAEHDLIVRAAKKVVLEVMDET